MANERIKCGICNSMILPATAQSNGGLCAHCVKIPPPLREIAAAVHAERNPFEHALEMYSFLIDSLVPRILDRNFGAICDPEFAGARLFAPDSITGLPDFDLATEVGSEVIDEIEHYLLADASGGSIFFPIVTKLRSVSPAFNSVGKTVFVASTGMRVEEVAWLIRYLNDRPTFERFLNEAGLTEEQVDVYNESYNHELSQAEQASSGNDGQRC